MGLFGGKSGKSEVNRLSGDLKNKDLQAQIIIQSIGEGVIATDVLNRVMLMNKVAANITEWPIDEALGIDARRILTIIKDEKSMEAMTDVEHPFYTVLQTKQTYIQTIPVISRNKKPYFISLNVAPVVGQKGEVLGIVASFRDVSRERKEEQRSAEFISTASHEMRTPVAAIEGYLALAMNENVSKIDARAREYLEKAHSSTQHLGQLFQDLLTSAKAEDGRLQNHPEVVEMGAFVQQLAEDIRFSAEKKGLNVEFISGTNTKGSTDATSTASVGKTIAPLYYANIDPDRIREVITNLFDNAVKYTDQGKISIGITGNEKVIQIRIADTGGGIAKEDLPHLFQKFYRVDNSATRSVGGTGLGLFICKAIVELYNGAIWADSKIGEGSTFYINLPRLSSQQAAHLQSQQTSKPSINV